MYCLAHSRVFNNWKTVGGDRLEDAYKVRGKVVVVGVRGRNNWTKGTPSFVNQVNADTGCMQLWFVIHFETSISILIRELKQ